MEKENKVKKWFGETKTKVKNWYDDTKERLTNYGSNIKKAYDNGYKHGWDVTNSPDGVFCSSIASSIGYGNGIRAKRKYLKQIKYSKKSKFKKV